MGIQKEWEAYGFKCRVLDSSVSSYNGYVGVPKDHPYHGESYWDFAIDVHGGVTYASMGDDKEYEGSVLFPDTELYWIGFDTAHSGDWVSYSPERGGRRWSVEDVAFETEQMAKQLRAIMNGEVVKRELSEHESQEKLRDFNTALSELEGVKIPFNIIKKHLEPLRDWLDSEFDSCG